MRLIERVSGFVTANLHDLIDQCEDPETMLKQAVREMEAALGQLLDGAARAIAHHKLLVRQLDEQERSIARLMQRAEAAVARGDDEAARRELKCRAEQQQLAASLTAQTAAAAALAERLRTQVAALRLRLAQARRRLVEVTARHRATKAQRKLVGHLPKHAELGGGAASFTELCARVEQSEAETEALLELLGEAELSEPLDDDIEAELRALKEKASHAAP